MYVAQFNTVLDGGSPVSYNNDTFVIAAAEFTVPQYQHTFNNLKHIVAHSDGDLGAEIDYTSGWVLVSCYHDEANQHGRVMVQELEQSGPNWVLGDILGSSTSVHTDPGNDIVYVRLQSYLRPASGTGNIKIKIVGMRNSVLTWPPYNPGTIPAPASVTATQQAPDSVTLTWTNVCDTFKIERKTGSGSYSTLQASYENNGTDSYTDTTVTETNTYTYRVTTILGIYESSSVESNPVTIDNTPFAGGDFILTQNLGSNVDVNDQRGFKFTVGATPITVTEVGLWVLGPPGQYSATISVDIYEADGTLIASNGVPTDGAIDQYVFVSIAPVNLSANTSYFCMTGALGFNTIKDQNTTATSLAPVATIVDAANGSAPTFSLDGAGANHLYGPVNFRWEYT